MPKFNIILIFIWIFSSSTALSAGLDRAKTKLENFKSELVTITPVVAIITLIILGIAYAFNFVEKETLFKWGIGIIIAGSAGPITNMFLS
ncbi:MAG: conjugal transfer protein [Sphingobacteriaceae bacterium]|nr:MAG: conjugal transfer protein [Sphingobacteriaceae bacterium]